MIYINTSSVIDFEVEGAFDPISEKGYNLNQALEVGDVVTAIGMYTGEGAADSTSRFRLALLKKPH